MCPTVIAPATDTHPAQAYAGGTCESHTAHARGHVRCHTQRRLSWIRYAAASKRGLPVSETHQVHVLQDLVAESE